MRKLNNKKKKTQKKKKKIRKEQVHGKIRPGWIIFELE